MQNRRLEASIHWAEQRNEEGSHVQHKDNDVAEERKCITFPLLDDDDDDAIDVFLSFY